MSGKSKNLRRPDESIEMPGITEQLVEVGEMTVGRSVQEPGWRWSTHIKPIVRGEWCEAHHVGVVLSGPFGADFRDGSRLELGPDDVYDIPPGHDGYTIGQEPAVLIEWSGLRTFARGMTGAHGRVLATLLFTDLVDSTATAVKLGDVAWRELLTRHYLLVRAQLDRFHGREVKTTGDGLLAVLDAPVSAVRCAAGIRAASLEDDVPVRIGVHIGEVDAVGADIRGVAVHEAARVMATAGANEILVTETVKALSGGAELSFEDRGIHTLKGLREPLRLFAYAD
jgi:class 3 adenylate cyclase